jgi:hypothetical protein
MGPGFPAASAEGVGYKGCVIFYVGVSNVEAALQNSRRPRASTGRVEWAPKKIREQTSWIIAGDLTGRSLTR